MVTLNLNKAVPPLVLINAVAHAANNDRHLEIIIDISKEAGNTFVDAKFFKLSFLNLLKREVASMRILRRDGIHEKTMPHKIIYPISDKWGNGEYARRVSRIYDYLARFGYHQVIDMQSQ